MSNNGKTKENQNRCQTEKFEWPLGFEYPSMKWYPSEVNIMNVGRKNADNLLMPPAVVRKAPWRG